MNVVPDAAANARSLNNDRSISERSRAFTAWNPKATSSTTPTPTPMSTW